MSESDFRTYGPLRNYLVSAPLIFNVRTLETLVPRFFERTSIRSIRLASAVRRSFDEFPTIAVWSASRKPRLHRSGTLPAQRPTGVFRKARQVKRRRCQPKLLNPSTVSILSGKVECPIGQRPWHHWISLDSSVPRHDECAVDEDWNCRRGKGGQRREGHHSLLPG